MKYVRCPDVYQWTPEEDSIFLGGGISNCSDWQSELAEMLKHLPMAVINPRREVPPTSEREQIEWEFDHLNLSTMKLFWFCKETVCPITLFEFGKWIRYQHTERGNLFVGMNPDYSRRTDVEIQLSCERDDVAIVHDLKAIASQIESRINQLKGSKHENPSPRPPK